MGTIRNADLVCVVVEAGEPAFDQIEALLAVLGARGLTLRTLPRNQLNAAEPSVRAGLVVANKSEQVSTGELQSLRELYDDRLEVLAVSAHTRLGLEAWFRRLWELLAAVRVYAKEPGRPPDLGKPFVLPVGATVADLARQIHRDLADTMKFARLWGHGRFEGQHVHKTEPLQDRDIVEIHE
jgi:ribosome-interacting GTPase 1